MGELKRWIRWHFCYATLGEVVFVGGAVRHSSLMASRLGFSKSAIRLTWSEWVRGGGAAAQCSAAFCARASGEITVAWCWCQGASVSLWSCLSLIFNKSFSISEIACGVSSRLSFRASDFAELMVSKPSSAAIAI